MLQKTPLRRNWFMRLIQPPHHIRVNSFDYSIEACLRSLEQGAGLPKGDLTVRPNPEEVATFPAMRNGLKHIIDSATSERWRADPKKEGYIAGSIFETVGSSMLSREQTDGMNPLVAAVVQIPYVCIGNLHVSKNCPGVYSGNVCSTCGDRAPSFF